MLFRPALAALALSVSLVQAGAANAAPAPIAAASPAPAAGVIRLQSHHTFDETVTRLKAAIAAKGVRYFDAIDLQQLGKDANLPIGRSTIVRFGNPPLGIQFLQANRYAGLDWPVRMLVLDEADGSVWLAWQDFGFIAKRYGITTLDPQFKMASEVAGSIAADTAD
jgi:uncharacterized protein (DUF302 family)